MEKLCGLELFSFGTLAGGISFALCLGRCSSVVPRWLILVYQSPCVLCPALYGDECEQISMEA